MAYNFIALLRRANLSLADSINIGLLTEAEHLQLRRILFTICIGGILQHPPLSLFARRRLAPVPFIDTLSEFVLIITINFSSNPLLKL
jgi:hypothetical protein